MKIKILILPILLIAIVIGIFIISGQKSEQVPVENQGIVIQNIVANQEISSPLVIEGSINGDGWTAFEAVCGRVDLVNDNGENIASTRLNATSEWMALPVNFASVLSFEINAPISGSLIFHNENPSGDSQRDKIFKIPVKIVNSEVNFNKTGNLLINNPGFEKDVWYLVYEYPGHPAVNAKLWFDENSACTDGCSKFSNGDRVTIFGIENNGAVLVKVLVAQ